MKTESIKIKVTRRVYLQEIYFLIYLQKFKSKNNNNNNNNDNLKLKDI